MKIIISGRNITLTDGIKDYAEEKFSRLEDHYDFLREVHVFLSVEKNPRINASQRAEATVHVNRAILRVEVCTDSLYASIDALTDKVERSLSKHKTKLLGRTKAGHTAKSIRKAGFEEALAEEAETQETSEMEEGVHLLFDDEAEAALAEAQAKS